MLSSLFESFFPSDLRMESQAGVHAGESQATQSDTSTSTISDPEEAQQHKDELGERQQQAQEESEDEEDPEDVRPTVLSLTSPSSASTIEAGPGRGISPRLAGLAGVAVWSLYCQTQADTLVRSPQQAEAIREGASSSPP
jgi:hypothetical protein